MHSNTNPQTSHRRRVVRFFSVALLFFVIISPFIFHQNVFADSSNVVETNFFGNVKDDDNGCGVYTILNLVIDILSIGIILTAVIGVTIVGIKYITAKDSTEQTQKAKSRMLEIVIGLVAYAVLYVGAQFLLPGGHFTVDSSCTTISDEELAKIKAKEQTQKTSPSSNNGVSSGSNSKSNTSKTTNSASLEKWYDAMEKQFKYMKNAKYGSNYKSNFELSKREGTCITFVSTSLQRLGVIPKNKYVWISESGKITGTAASFIKNHKNTFEVFYPNKTAKQLKKEGKIKKGDIVAYNYNRGKSNDASHIMVFMGFNSKDNPLFNTWGHYRKLNSEHSTYANRKINMIIRLKKTSL